VSTLQSPSRMKHDALELSLNRLSQAVVADMTGQERWWTEAVGTALACVETALRQHRAAAKAPDGLLAEVDETRPTLARQADGLRSDHDDFLAQVRALRDELRCVTIAAFRCATDREARTEWIVNICTIRQMTANLLTGIQENKEAETKLVLESINTDIGVGD
jgi:hypothetical protein